MINKEIKVARALRHLFEATGDVEKWPAFLECITDLFDARGAYFFYFDLEFQKLSFHVGYGSADVDANMMKIFEELALEDPRRPYGLRHPEMPLTSRMCVDEETLHKSLMYKKFLKPTGAEYMLFSSFPNDPNSTASFGLLRGPEDRPFDQADGDLFGELVPSMKRAIELHKRLAFLDFNNRAALEGFDQLPFGFVLADEKGRVRFANHAAHEISAANDGFSLEGGWFFTDEPGDRSSMLRYIGHATRQARLDEILPAEGMTLTRPSGARAYEVVLSTVWGNHIRYDLGYLDEPVVAIHVTDPDRPLETSQDLLQRLFGLTPAEAGVVERIVRGLAVADIVRELEISHHTVRQHLSVAFEKTDTKRQSQLVQRILSAPVWIKAAERRKKFSQAQIPR